MQTSNRLEHPVLMVSLGGSIVEKRPSSFQLITDRGFPSVIAHLRFPADSSIGSKGDSVTVSLFYGNDEYLLFTGEIYDAATHGTYRDLALTDDYKKLCDTGIVAAYREEMASVILQDALDAAGIENTAITCPDVEVARFSTQNIPAEKVITHLIDVLFHHGHEGYRFFFDEKNIFHFGTKDDTGKNDGEVFEFETGKTIFKKGAKRIDVLPLPIRHTQDVLIDGEKHTTFRTDLSISGNRSRLYLWMEASK